MIPATSPLDRLPQVARLVFGIALLQTCSLFAASASDLEILAAPADDAGCITLVGGRSAAAIVVDAQDYPVVQLAANFFADDVRRVTGRRLSVTNQPAAVPLIIAGTLGHSALIDQLAADGKLKQLDQIKGRWEATLWQVVEKPFPGVERALVIVGSDRRGAAYGLMRLSENIGVSPWYWWADVPTAHRDTVTVKVSAPQMDAPAVKYRGIFINDEDWGLYPWAKDTFDPTLKNIGPKTYEKVFELMLRLRLNYLWPAMHACSTEFGSLPENTALADKFAIVAGSSHCEPMLCNNVHWDQKEKGPWNYSLNRDTIHAYWEDTVKARSSQEAVWTLGIRGIHDAGMQRPPNTVPDRIRLLGEVFQDQRALLDHHVTREWGPVAQCFVPYKEVLPLYDAGLKVPDDVTLVWVDDNFGYLRRLSAPAERQRAGGAGVYWHLSYYGGPHSYTWINTTAPALIWEELSKAWENDARNLWVINVGDLKPMEIGIDYFAELAWNPAATGPDSQPHFLRAFAVKAFGENLAQPVADLLGEFYRLGTIRKPELMNRAWALALPAERAAQLRNDYENLLRREQKIAATIPAETRDAYFELVGFPVRVLGTAGLIFMADRDSQFGKDVAANESAITRLRADLESQVEHFNLQIAGGKWNRMMPGLVTGKDLTKWSSQVRWPWGDKPEDVTAQPQRPIASNRTWRDAAEADLSSAAGAARWVAVAGLGASGRAMALKPATLDSSWKAGDSSAPMLAFEFQARGNNGEALIDFLPTFRIYPGMQLRVTVGLDDQSPIVVEVPGSSGKEDENGPNRSHGILNNFVQATVALPKLSAGRHVLKIRAMDPGVVIDRVALP